MNNVNEGWRSVRALMLLTGLALCASAFAADPTPAAAGAVATPDAAVAAAPESAPDATADNGAAPVRFLVMANQESPLSSVVAGRVSQVNVELGDTVKAGKLLVTLDCSELKARRDAADAEYSAAQIKYEAKAKLQGLHSAGAQVIDLVSNGTRKARLNVPSGWTTWLAPGAQLDAVVGETGKHYPMTVTHISGRVDAVSQTIEIEAEFGSDAQDVLPGMSGRATPVCPKAAAQCQSGTTNS